ncbi:ATP-binding protein [Desulfopila sp. IMCC35008]|uniref:PAS domain-containing hybrid sensor histidine kinase/response regulator n=1 Tax=Desulfopila sp. IMCC35008 TaxID=2653858 RepID=UPI0013D0199F|nr:ATP-binding protein [Desulfopila sp. IMCC35008]
MSLEPYKITSNELLREQLRAARQQNEELKDQLLKSEQILDHYRQSVDNSPNAIFSIDLEGYITTWNPSSSDVFQYDSTILGSHFRNLLQNQADIDFLEREILQSREMKALSNIDLTYRCKNGETREMVSRIYPVKSNGGHVHGFVFANTDITERNKLHRELELYRHHLEELVDERTSKLQEEIRHRKDAQSALQMSYDAVVTILDSMDHAIQVTSVAQGELIFMNNQLQTLLEEGRKIGSDYNLFASLISTERPVEPLKLSDNNGDELERSEIFFDDVMSRWYVLDECIITWVDGRLVRLQVATDITERKQIDDEKKRVERLESLGVLAGGIAHDFNNLLTGIMGSLSLLKIQTEDGSSNHSLLDSAEKAASRATSLTRQLLTFSKGGAPVRKVISLETILKEEVEFALRGSSVGVTMNIDDDLSHIEADSGQLSQVFHNLALNAMQAMPEGGRLIIVAENVFLKEGAHSADLPGGKYIKVEFRDSGPGIIPEIQEKIFEPYFSTKATGKGLGLATVHKIIVKHNGKISVHSKVDGGTIFRMYLPSSDHAAVVLNEKAQLPVAMQGRILLMDDDEIICEVATAILSRLGYVVDSVADGETLVARYAASRSEGQAYDAVIMDLTIQGGMGGEEAVKKLLQINPKVQAIASSGYADSPIMSDCLQYGFAAILQKPYKVEEMASVLRQVIDR